MQIKWKDEYSVNIAEIDKQHKKLFELAERVYTMANLDDDYDDYDEIMDVLKELKDYTVYHFGYEEQLMDKYGYERTEAHKIEHHFVVKKIQKFESRDVDDMQKETILDLLAFVSDWIAGHILKEDMAYKEFFNSHGIY